jgi:nucleoid-associated protein YgaU
MNRVLTRFFNIAQLVAAVVGIPWLLVTYVGWCLPTSVSWNDVSDAWSMGDLDPLTVVKALACALWLTWALVMISLAVHIGCRLLRVKPERPAFVPKRVFAITGRWVGGVALTATTSFMSMGGSALAATNATPLAQVSQQLQRSSTTLNTAGTGGLSFGTDSKVETSSSSQWTVKSGDTLWEIAEATLGDGTKWRSIVEANPSLSTSSDELPVGMVLRIPDGSRASRVSDPVTTSADVTAPVIGTVTVEPGDHFWRISEDVLTEAYGRAVTDDEITPYWRDMVELNRDNVASNNPNLIYAGEQYDVLLPPLPAEITDRTITLPNPVTRLDVPIQGVETDPVPVDQPAPVEAVVAVVEEAPAVVAPTVAPASAAPPVVSPVLAEADSGSADELPVAALAAVGLSAVAAGALLIGLRRRRAVAARTRDPREVLEEPTEDMLSLLSRIRAIATPDVTVTMDGVQRLLRRELMAAKQSAPAISVARAGRNGVELLLETPDPNPPHGFVAVDDGACWVLSPDVTAAMLEEVRHTETSLLPGLVSVGSNEIGSVLVDVERLGALEIRSDDPHTTGVGVLASMAAEFEGAPWLDQDESELFGIGLPVSLFGGYERLRLIDDSEVEAVVRSMCDTARNEAVQHPDGKHAMRVSTSALVYPPTIVLVGPDQAEVAKQLGEAALHSGSGLCVIALDMLPQGSSALVVTGKAAVLEPYGLDLDSVGMMSPAMASTVSAAMDGSDNIAETLPWPETWELSSTTESVISNGSSNGSGWGVDGHHGDGDETFDGFDESFEPTELTERAESVSVEELRELTLEEFVDLSTYVDEQIGALEPAVDENPDDGPDDDPNDDPNGPRGGYRVDGEFTDAVDSVSRAQELLDELLTPAGTVMFRMLSESMPTLTGTTVAISGRTAPRAVEVVAFLTLRQPAPPARLLESLWPTHTDHRTVVKAISRIRSGIAPANILLNEADKYCLDGVDSDWARFGQLVEAAQTLDSSGATLLLKHALELVQCCPFEGRKGPAWEWLDHGYVEADVRVRIVDASESLAELALDAGDASLALWSCEKARLCEPHREATHQLRMRAYAMLGDRDGLKREVKLAQASAMIDDPFAEISTNTQQLLRVLEAQFSDQHRERHSA